MLYLEGLCACCEAGVLGIRRCDDGATLVLMCEECDAVWLDPADRSIEVARYADIGTFELPGLPLKLGGGAAGWATRADVARAGWSRHVRGETADPGASVRKKR
jgi:hypothetical protein